MDDRNQVTTRRFGTGAYYAHRVRAVLAQLTWQQATAFCSVLALILVLAAGTSVVTATQRAQAATLEAEFTFFPIDNFSHWQADVFLTNHGPASAKDAVLVVRVHDRWSTIIDCEPASANDPDLIEPEQVFSQESRGRCQVGFGGPLQPSETLHYRFTFVVHPDLNGAIRQTYTSPERADTMMQLLFHTDVTGDNVVVDSMYPPYFMR